MKIAFCMHGLWLTRAFAGSGNSSVLTVTVPAVMSETGPMRNSGDATSTSVSITCAWTHSFQGRQIMRGVLLRVSVALSNHGMHAHLSSRKTPLAKAQGSGQSTFHAATHSMSCIPKCSGCRHIMPLSQAQSQFREVVLCDGSVLCWTLNSK